MSNRPTFRTLRCAVSSLLLASGVVAFDSVAEPVLIGDRQEVFAALEGDDRLRIDRPDGQLATLTRTGRPDRQHPLKRRELGDLIAEELRRLDSDQPYAEALAAVTGEQGLHERSAMRSHIWRDPVTGATT